MTRTAGGIDYMAAQISGSPSATNVANNIGISNCTSSPSSTNVATTTASGTLINWGTANATDAAASTSRGEYTGLGFTRKSGGSVAYAHTASTNTFSLTTTFTATGTFTALQAVGLFTQTTQGTGVLVAENTFTATSGISGDQLTIAWTFTL